MQTLKRVIQRGGYLNAAEADELSEFIGTTSIILRWKPEDKQPKKDEETSSDYFKRENLVKLYQLKSRLDTEEKERKRVPSEMQIGGFDKDRWERFLGITKDAVVEDDHPAVVNQRPKRNAKKRRSDDDD